MLFFGAGHKTPQLFNLREFDRIVYEAASIAISAKINKASESLFRKAMLSHFKDMFNIAVQMLLNKVVIKSPLVSNQLALEYVKLEEPRTSEDEVIAGDAQGVLKL